MWFSFRLHFHPGAVAENLCEISEDVLRDFKKDISGSDGGALCRGKVLAVWPQWQNRNQESAFPGFSFPGCIPRGTTTSMRPAGRRG